VVEPYAKGAPSTRGLDNVWLGCHRGKRCVSLDMTTSEGREALHRLVATADVVHSNRGRGMLRAFGLDYETVKSIKPDIIYCHTTAYGETGPQAGWPGSDQLAEGVCGLEWEQGGVPNGGASPQWYRFGQCDHGSGFLSAIAVLQALYHRDRTGEGQAVDTNILNSGMLFSSDAFVAPEGIKTRAHQNGDETGLGPLYRLYGTKAGWLFVVATDDEEWQALCRGLEQAALADDPRFATVEDRERNADELTSLLQGPFRERTASAWFDALDGAGAPCEIVREGIGQGYGFFDDPDNVANGWVARYHHEVMGTIEQPGSFFSLSRTPSVLQGAPPIRGQHSVEILRELGYTDTQIAALVEKGATFVAG
jgi:crotonobetainyl-CoA:carnitine CoA-transferase CaiB-like acyl-CoA transferase